MAHASPPSHPHACCGTVLMEAVLCLPLLLFLVTGIVQFSRIWEAKLMTRHAAYNAARAALVYNVSQYASVKGDRIRFFPDRGPVWLAAVNTLAWKSATDSSFGEGDNYPFPGFSDDLGRSFPDYRIPNSAFIQDQVRIVADESFESNGVVRVTVGFKFPLLFSVFALGSTQGDRDRDLPFGDDDERVPLVHDSSRNSVGPFWDEGTPHIRLRETRSLPKPWSTAHFPRVSKDEAEYMDMEMTP